MLLVNSTVTATAQKTTTNKKSRKACLNGLLNGFLLLLANTHLELLNKKSKLIIYVNLNL